MVKHSELGATLSGERPKWNASNFHLDILEAFLFFSGQVDRFFFQFRFSNHVVIQIVKAFQNDSKLNVHIHQSTCSLVRHKYWSLGTLEVLTELNLRPL